MPTKKIPAYILRRATVLREEARRGDSLTAVRAPTNSRTVHLGFDHGSYDTLPLCGRLANRPTETTDETANCGLCRSVVRALGIDYLIKDESGWTGLWTPHRG